MKLSHFVHLQKMCYRKISYKSKEKAESSALRIQKKENIKLRAYLCPCCSYWHLTKNATIHNKEKNATIHNKENMCYETHKECFKSEKDIKYKYPNRFGYLCPFCNFWHKTSHKPILPT